MRHIKNPFVSGGKVAGQAFWNREKEIKKLAGDIRSGQHVILLAQRRLGKTSLVCKVLEEVRKEGIVPVYVDLYPVSTLRELIEAYAKVIAGALSTFSTP